ncbi:MAG: hypothetical protein ACOH1R_07615 [Luteimonas sp.]
MDDALWERGFVVANGRGHTTTWELDFLRGMHNGEALSDLAASLKVTTGHDIRLMSIWLDKTAWVSWVDLADAKVKKRELADLAVIVRKEHGGAIEPWMWIMQAKRVENLAQRYTGESTDYELDLLHRMPEFELRGSERSFDLTKEFHFTNGLRTASAPWGCEVSTPWTFLDLDANRHSKTSAAAHGYSPISARWTGCPPEQGSWADQWMTECGYQSLAINSYTRCLEAIIQGTPIPWAIPTQPSAGRPFVPGAPANDQFPQWQRLYRTLLDTLSGVKTGHAGTLKGQKGDAIQVSEFVRSGSKLLYSETLAKRAIEFCEISRGNCGLTGVVDVEGASSFSWFQTFGNSPNSWNAISRFDEALAKSHGGDSRIDGPAENVQEFDGRGMQVLIVDVLGERSVG